jgi:hypothetical protein
MAVASSMVDVRIFFMKIFFGKEWLEIGDWENQSPISSHQLLFSVE